jgi:drug/metabolite transporter (DMT)-like permease
MQALILGLAAALAWGVHDLLVRRIAGGTNVLGQIMVVMTVGAVILGTLGGAGMVRLSGTAVLLAALAGLSYVLAFVGLYRAFALAPVKVVSPVMGAYPLLSMLAAAAMGAPVTPADWLAVVAVVAGVAVVALLAEGEAKNLRPALIWSALGSCGFGAAFALGQAASVGDQSLAAGAVTRGVAALSTLGLVLWQRPSLQPVRQYWRVLIVMALLDTAALALVMLAGGLPHAEYASVAASLFGVVTIVLAWMTLGEKVRPAQWLGVVLVFAGMSALAL